MEKYKIWLDCDTGIDDSIAIITALKLPCFEIVGASAVAGNAYLKYTFANTRNVFSLAGREDIKVYKGADRPLFRPYSPPEFHKANGLGNAIIPDSKAPIETKSAYDALYEKAVELQGELTVIAIGPLTNIAITIASHPDIVKLIKKLVIMGGSVAEGNITPCAEFNIICDPDAAEAVFKSGIEIVMCGLDVTHKTRMTGEDIDEIYSYGNAVGKLLYDSTLYVKEFHNSGNRAINLHDSCTFMYLAYPELFKAYHCGVYVETQGTITLGKTVCDLYSDHKFEDRHCTVVMDVNNDKFIQITKDIYRSYK